jgi:hypothetical protein
VFKWFAWGAFSVLVALSIAVVNWGGTIGWTEGIVGAFAGALAGAAASMLGSLLERHQAEIDRKRDADQQRQQDEQRRQQIEAAQQVAENERLERIKALLTVDLVHIAVGHMEAARALVAARTAAQQPGANQNAIPLSGINVRGLSFLRAIGSDVLQLSARELDVIGTLQANLDMSLHYVQELRTGARRFAFLEATTLQRMLNHDLGLIEEAFVCLAPTRQLRLPGAEPELASQILHRTRVETEVWQ